MLKFFFLSRQHFGLFSFWATSINTPGINDLGIQSFRLVSEKLSVTRYLIYLPNYYTIVISSKMDMFLATLNVKWSGISVRRSFSINFHKYTIHYLIVISLLQMIIRATQINETITNTPYTHKLQNHCSPKSSGSSTSMHKRWYQRSHPSHSSQFTSLSTNFIPSPIPTSLFSSVPLQT